MTRTKSLGEVVQEERTWQLWTQAGLAKRAKVSQSLIENIERGAIATLRPLTAQKIGQALGVDLTRWVKR
jgi:transcriptional regulator with XRE-family HTH domain